MTEGLTNIDSFSLIDIDKIEIIQVQHNDPLLRDIISKCELSSSNIWKDYKFNDNVLYYIDETLKNEKFVIPLNLRESILGLNHNHELSTVHMAPDKMIQLYPLIETTKSYWIKK